MRVVAVAVAAGLVLAGCVYQRASSAIDIPPALRARSGGYDWRNWAFQSNQAFRAQLAQTNGFIRNEREQEFLRQRSVLAAEVDAGRISPDEFDQRQRQDLASLQAVSR